MSTLLNNISQLDSIQEVLLLSIRGELLFCYHQDSADVVDQKITNWNDVIASMERPVAAEFLYDEGCYYLRYTDVGYLIVGIGDDLNYEKVKKACVNVQTKLADSAIRKRALLEMLTDVDDLLKPQIIKELVPLADREVAMTLLSLLKNEADFHPDVKEKLLLFICQALGHCSSHKVVGSLKKFLQKYKAGKNVVNGEIEKAALISIRQLELDKHVEDKTSQNQTAGKVWESKGEVTNSVPNKKEAQRIETPPEERQINELLDSDRKGEAVSLIMRSIETAARQKQFEKAEKLRDWLIRIDSMSLMEIIHAAEIIEEEKSASISKEHLETWKDLVDILAPDEFSTLYHSMISKNYINGEMVVEQGTFLPTMFFVNSGSVRLSAVTEDKEVPLRVLGPGEIVEGGTFFEASVWTINAKSLGADVFLLPRNKMQTLKDNYPALESKLFDFCARFQSPNAIFQRTKSSRRRFERKKVSGRTAIVILDKTGRETGIGAKGDLFDLSKGGVSFCLRISQKKNAILLFGKKIRITIPAGIRKPALLRTGVIVAVRGHHLVSNEYSLHVDFDQQLSIIDLQQVNGTD